MGSNHHELSCSCLKIEHTRKKKSNLVGQWGILFSDNPKKMMNYRETTYGEMYDLTDG